MASFTLTTSQTYPAGTTVEVHARDAVDMPPAAPLTPVITSAAMGATGSVTFTGLADGTRYWAYALVAGAHRYVAFETPNPHFQGEGTDFATQAELDAAVAAQQPQARVYNSANLSIPNGASTLLTFDSERFDSDGAHSTSVNPGRLTCVTAGLYFVWANVLFAVNNTGSRQAKIVLNGTTGIGALLINNNGISLETEVVVSALYRLAVGDYVTVEAFQNSGGALNVLAVGNHSPEFAWVRVSP